MRKKGDCFEIAGRNVMEHKGWKLCHGTVSGQGHLEGKRFDHAWNEEGDIVFDNSNGRDIVMRKERYYELGKISDVKRYTREQAMKLMLKTKNFGPWEVEKWKWQL